MRRSKARRPPEVDSTLALVRRLQHRAGRDRTGLFYAEGVGMLLHAADRGAPIERLVVSWRLLIAPVARQVVRRLRRTGTKCVLVTPEEFRAVSMRERACGVGLVLRQVWTPITAIDPRRGTAWLLLREVRSPGNFGTLLRSLAAAGGGGVILLGEQIDAFDPAVVRATMGGLFCLALVRAGSEELRALKRDSACVVVGTSPQATASYAEVPWHPGSLIFLGGERKGLSAQDLELCDRVVQIPMRGPIDSLNLGVAGSLMIYEALRGLRPPPT